MDRRAAVKNITAILGAAVSVPTLAGILGGCQAGVSGNLRTLSGAQYRVLDVMTEHILPATDTPGARAAGVADYIDAMLTDFYSDENRQQFLAGLAKTEEKAKETFNKAFMSCSSEEQFALLNDLDKAAFPDLDAMDDAAKKAYQQQLTSEGKPFIATLKELTLAGFYTSEVGATQELHINPMGAHRGDIPYEEIGLAWA